MKAMVCEMCQSNDLVKQDGMYVCQYCGTKYTVDEARKLLGTVKIDKTEETQKLLILARRARDDQNSENAEKYYGLVLLDDPNNWEAAFFQIYFQSMQCKIMDITNAAYSVANCIEGVIELIGQLEDRDELDAAIATVTRHSSIIANLLAKAAKNHFIEHSTVNNAIQKCVKQIVAAHTIFLQLEDGLKKHFPAKIDALVSLQKEYNKFLNDYYNFINKDYRVKTSKRLTSEIKQHDASYVQPTKKSDGCYVATAIYGSYDCPQVWTLRRFRDNTLAETWYGRAFIRVYYAISPTLVKLFGKTEWFKNLWKPTLDRMVENLNESGVEDTPYDDRA